jgi:hypothetical protein
MKLTLALVLTTAIVGWVLTAPSASNAAPPTHPPPTQDSVLLTGGPAIGTTFTALAIDAGSGPSGENPTGRVDFEIDLGFGPPFPVSGSVTCLAVSGNAATMNIDDPGLISYGLSSIVTVQVTDDEPDTFDSPAIGRAPTDCSPASPSGEGGPVSGGDITVVDAEPPPASKAECKNGGWQRFGFKNQGECIAFVNAQRQ